MRLMILERNHLVNRLEATDGPVTIGSGAHCTVHLPDTRIGMHQASLVQDADGAWWLEVLDRNVPTCLNRAVQHSKAKLRHADEIELGEFAIRLYLETDASRAELQRQRMKELLRARTDGLPLGTIVVKSDDECTLAHAQLEQFALLAMQLERVESVNDLLAQALQAVMRTFGGRRAWIAVRKTPHDKLEWNLGLSQKEGVCPQPPLASRMEDRCLTDGHGVCTPNVQGEGVGAAMAVPLRCQSGILGMAYVENDPADPPYDEPAVGRFSGMAHCIAIPLEDVMRRSAAARLETAGAQRRLTVMLQDAVTPSVLPRWRRLEVAAYRRPGSQNTCDVYDILQLRDKSAAVVLARLSAEGPAVMRQLAELRAAFRMAVLHGDGPHLFLRAMNWLMHGAGSPADAAVVWISEETGQVRFSCAGRRVMLGRMFVDGRCQPVETPPTPPVGSAPGIAYETGEMTLADGETLILATDGVEAAVNAEAAPFGREGLKDSLCDGVGAAPGSILAEFANDLRDHVAGGACPDDVTVILVRRT